MNREGLFPEIRFKEFDDVWKQYKLGDMADKFEYGLNSSAIVYDGENKYIRITDIDEATNKFLMNKITSPDADLSVSDNYILKEGDILFARTGASVGKTYQYDKRDGKVYFAGFLIRARIRNHFDSQFVFQNTLTLKYDNFIRVMSQRSGQPGINAQEYASFQIVVPNKEEQIKIGKLFQSIDEIIVLQQQLLNDHKQLKKAMQQKMFPQKGEKIPKVRFAGFTDEWKKDKIKDLLIERNERSGDGELISVTINSGIVKTADLDRTDNSSKDKSNYKKVEKGDIAYNSMRMWQGASGLSKYTGIVSPAYTIVIPNERVIPLFISYQFKLPNMIQTFQANSQGLTSDTWNLKYPLLKKIKIKIPELDEQVKIGNFFKQLDETIDSHEKKLETYQELKKAMLQKMFV